MLLCEVAFTEWTGDGHIRHPSFQGLREDKAPKAVTMEKPVAVKASRPTKRRTAGLMCSASAFPILIACHF